MARLIPETVVLPDGACVELRSARPDDLPAIAALTTALLADGAGQIVDPDEWSQDEPERWLEHLTDSRTSLCMVAVVAGRIAGLVDVNGYTRRRQAHGAWWAIGLHPVWRRRGLGQRMIQRMLRWAEGNAHLEELDLHVRSDNPHAIALYARFGFEEVGRRPRAFREGPDHYIADVLMVRSVRSP